MNTEFYKCFNVTGKPAILPSVTGSLVWMTLFLCKHPTTEVYFNLCLKFASFSFLFMKFFSFSSIFLLSILIIDNILNCIDYQLIHHMSSLCCIGASNHSVFTFKKSESIILKSTSITNTNFLKIHIFGSLGSCKWYGFKGFTIICSHNKGFRWKYEYYSPKLTTNQVFSQWTC